MTLIDTSVWSEQFRAPNPEVGELLATDRALMHPMVLGELSLSPFRRVGFDAELSKLSLLEQVEQADDEAVMHLVQRFKLWGRGIGWVDCHLLAAAREAHCHLLTKDQALKSAWLMVRPK